jgi:hypothetical protein
VDRYFQVISSEEKHDISKEIVDAILVSCGGRFLKRGNHCWEPIDPSEARKKVAQALQYQRRKITKRESAVIGQETNMNSDFSSIPPPPVLRRHEQINPKKASFPEMVKARSSRKKDVKQFQIKEMSKKLVRDCIHELTKSSEEGKKDKVKSSLYDTSIVQATAQANIATCGKPTYASHHTSSLNQLIAKSRKIALRSNASSGILPYNFSKLGNLNTALKHQQQEKEVSWSPSLSCGTSSQLYLDSCGDSLLPDMDVSFYNEYFEPDETLFG